MYLRDREAIGEGEPGGQGEAGWGHVVVIWREVDVDDRISTQPDVDRFFFFFHMMFKDIVDDDDDDVLRVQLSKGRNPKWLSYLQYLYVAI